MQTDKIVAVFGGGGFVGRAVVRALADQGYMVRVATRNPLSCYEMKVYGTPGQVVPTLYNPARPDTIGSVIDGSVAVINCVGVLFEKRKRASFYATHVELVRQIATASKRYGVVRLVHISAVGIEHGSSRYAQTKMQGEKAVRELFPSATILRPSVIFGPDDNFFNMFAGLARMLPCLPLIGGGHTKFQPVYVRDVALAIARCVMGVADVCGKTYELRGPDVITFKQIYETMFKYTGGSRALVPVPFGVAKLQASVMQLFPKPILTVDQVKSLRTDSVVSQGALTLNDLGISPTSLDSILPTYLDRYRVGEKFSEKKYA